MMKSAFLLLLMLLGYSQGDPVRSIKTKAENFQVDDLGFIYTIYKDRVEKLYPDGRLFYEFSFKNSGAIGQFNVVDPLKPLVYFPDTGDLIVLDNTMSQQRDLINLYNYGFGFVTCAATSMDHHFWIYDSYRGELLRLNDSFKQVVTSGNLVQLLGENPNPNYVFERNNRVYLCDPEMGIYVFDIFGGFVERLAESEFDSPSVVDGTLFFEQNDSLFAFDNAFDGKQLVMARSSKKLMFQNKFVYSLEGDVIRVFDAVMHENSDR